MGKQEFKVGILTVWILAVGSITFSVAVLITKFQYKEISQLMLILGLIFSFSAWIIVLNDIIRTKLYNKTFWIMSILILPTLTPIIYLMQRNKFIRLWNKFRH